MSQELLPTPKDVLESSLYHNLQQLSKAGFNLLELVKHHSRRLLWGRGYTFVGKDKQFIEEIFERMRGEMWFGKYHNLLFRHGLVIILIDKTKDGKLNPSIPFLQGASNVAKLWETEELAVTWERVVHSFRVILVFHSGP